MGSASSPGWARLGTLSRLPPPLPLPLRDPSHARYVPRWVLDYLRERYEEDAAPKVFASEGQCSMSSHSPWTLRSGASPTSAVLRKAQRWGGEQESGGLEDRGHRRHTRP